MIHDFLKSCKEDFSVLTHWMKGDKVELENGEDINRLQVAAFRMLATVAMVFGGLWALHIITFVVTFPIVIICKLTLAVCFYAIAHDVFIMSQNTTYPDFSPKKEKPSLFGFFRGKEVSEEEMAKKFTHGTFLQPVWMWMYVNRNKLHQEEPAK